MIGTRALTVERTARALPRIVAKLKRSRYAWLTNPSNLSSSQKEQIDRLSAMNLLTAKAYQMRLLEFPLLSAS